MHKLILLLLLFSFIIIIFILPHFLTSSGHYSSETTKNKNFIFPSLELQCRLVADPSMTSFYNVIVVNEKLYYEICFYSIFSVRKELLNLFLIFSDHKLILIKKL